MNPKYDMPIDLATHQFDVGNTWVLIGLPDNQAQHDASLARCGFGAQLSWLEFAESVQFGDQKFLPGHPLYGARVVKPDILPTGESVYRVDLHPSYSVRRKQLLYMQNQGLRVTLGASSRDFLAAAEEAFSCGGIFSLVTHFEIGRGFEFSDGFLSVDEIPMRRRPSGRGLLDLVTCDVAGVLRRVKLNLGSSTWAIGPTRKINAAEALLRRPPFWASIVEGPPATFAEHLKRADQQLSEVLNLSADKACTDSFDNNEVEDEKGR